MAAGSPNYREADMAKNKDYGLQFVNPDLIKVDPPVKENWQTTKDGGGGATRDEFGHGLEHLEEVKARIAEGQTEDELKALQRSDDPREKAIGDSYHMFYGEHPVQVERVGDDLITTDGRHRADLAQQYGLKEIPARVYTPADDPEFVGKLHDAARPPDSGERAQGEHKMGIENRRNPYESSPEDLQASEQTHADPMDPEMHEQYHQDANSAPADQSDAVDESDASEEAAEPGKDPMDGAEDARHSDRDSQEMLEEMLEQEPSIG